MTQKQIVQIQELVANTCKNYNQASIRNNTMTKLEIMTALDVLRKSFAIMRVDIQYYYDFDQEHDTDIIIEYIIRHNGKSFEEEL